MQVPSNSPPGNIPQNQEISTPQAKSVNKRLPEPVLKHLLSFLDQDKRETENVCKPWNKIATEFLKKECSLLNAFINNLQGEDLTKEVHEKLSTIKPIQKDSLGSTPGKVRAAFKQIREDILNVLKTLDEANLSKLALKLKEMPPKEIPKHFERIFDLAIIYKQLDELNKQEQRDSDRLIDVISKLANIGEYPQAHLLANSLPETWKAGTKMMIAFYEKGDSEKYKAELLAANKIQDEGKKLEAMRSIIKNVLSVSRKEFAQELVNLIDDEKIRGELGYLVKKAYRFVHRNARSA